MTKNLPNRGKTGDNQIDFAEYLKVHRQTINDCLLTLIPPESTSSPALHTSMHYSLMAGGKRLRPILALAAAEAAGGDARTVLPFACAIEMVHTYSLIHDDLPAMDNDDLRRGRPTSHKVFGEGMAILTGDALLTYAFLILSSPHYGSDIPFHNRLRIIEELAHASGIEGMIGGQVLDLDAQNKSLGLDEVARIHSLKTGCLIKASIRIGGIAAEARENEIEALSEYGAHLGLAFQITDDILDLEAPEEIMGKPKNSDLVNKKATYPTIIGIEASKKKAQESVEKALSSLYAFDHQADPLRHLAWYTIKREK
jgi:geranylgeranyl diphosphate synthase type II